MKLISLGLTAACLIVGSASADELKIIGVSVSKLSQANLCGALGGGDQPPAITIRRAPAVFRCPWPIISTTGEPSITVARPFRPIRPVRRM